MIIHFPIALFIISVAFDLFAIWKTNPVLAKAAFYNLIGAALTAPVAIASGNGNWKGGRLKGNLLLHLLFAVGASRDRFGSFPAGVFPSGNSRNGLIYTLLALATGITDRDHRASGWLRQRG